MVGSGRKPGCLDTSDIADIFSPTFHLKSNTKTWMFKIRDFQTSVFSIFACSQISKLGFPKSEIYKHPSF